MELPEEVLMLRHLVTAVAMATILVGCSSQEQPQVEPGVSPGPEQVQVQPQEEPEISVVPFVATRDDRDMIQSFWKANAKDGREITEANYDGSGYNVKYVSNGGTQVYEDWISPSLDGSGTASWTEDVLGVRRVYIDLRGWRVGWRPTAEQLRVHEEWTRVEERRRGDELGRREELRRDEARRDAVRRPEDVRRREEIKRHEDTKRHEETKRREEPKRPEAPKATRKEEPKVKGKEEPKPKGKEEPKVRGKEEPKPKGKEEPKPKPKGKEEPKPKGK